MSNATNPAVCSEQLKAVMSKHVPLIPEALSRHFLKCAGFETDDICVIRAASVMGQHFMEQIIEDADQFHKLRNLDSRRKRKRDMTLRMEDLSASLAENGIKVTKPAYYKEHS